MLRKIIHAIQRKPWDETKQTFTSAQIADMEVMEWIEFMINPNKECEGYLDDPTNPSSRQSY